MTYSFEYHICLLSKEAYTSMNMFVFPYWDTRTSVDAAREQTSLKEIK